MTPTAENRMPRGHPVPEFRRGPSHPLWAAVMSVTPSFYTCRAKSGSPHVGHDRPVHHPPPGAAHRRGDHDRSGGARRRRTARGLRPLLFLGLEEPDKDGRSRPHRRRQRRPALPRPAARRRAARRRATSSSPRPAARSTRRSSSTPPPSGQLPIIDAEFEIMEEIVLATDERGAPRCAAAASTRPRSAPCRSRPVPTTRRRPGAAWPACWGSARTTRRTRPGPTRSTASSPTSTSSHRDGRPASSTTRRAGARRAGQLRRPRAGRPAAHDPEADRDHPARGPSFTLEGNLLTLGGLGPARRVRRSARA